MQVAEAARTQPGHKLAFALPAPFTGDASDNGTLAAHDWSTYQNCDRSAQGGINGNPLPGTVLRRQYGLRDRIDLGFAEEPKPPRSPAAITVPINDLVIDRGAQGLWTLRNRNNLKRIFPSSPASIAVGDLNGDGRDDIIFGVTTPAARRGIWTSTNLGMPQQIDPRGGVRIAAGDFDGNGQADLIAAFQGLPGAHLRMNSGSFFEVHTSTPNAVAAGDLDGDGIDDVIISVPTGIFICYNAQAPWIQLHPQPAQNIIVANLDGNAKRDLIVDRGAQGIWKMMNNNNARTFTRINNGNPILMDRADPDGNGSDGVLGSFPNGLFFSSNGGTSWTRIEPDPPIDVAVADFNNDGQDDIVAIDPNSGLIYRQNNTGPWRPVVGPAVLPRTGLQSVVAAGLDGN